MAAATKKLPLQPIGGNILVKPEEQESTTESGLLIAATAKGEKPQRGIVLALGTGKKDKDGQDIAWSLAVGDEIYFKKYSPDELEIDGVTYLIMEEADVLAKKA